MLSPPSSACQSPSSNMYSTCRALQSLLASNLPTLSPSPKIIRAPPRLGSPIVLTSGPRAQPKKTKSHTVQNAKITKFPPRTPPPRSNLKRRRPCSDEPDPARDQEKTHNSKPSTPKRQRTCPPTLPLGLDRADFDALNPTSTPPHTPAPNPSPIAPKAQAQAQVQAQENNDADADDSEWTAVDDSALVALILNKLRLRPSDWDDCARELGKGKDSIGRRWAHLLGDGEVGLRRGGGRRVRGDVHGVGFGEVVGE